MDAYEAALKKFQERPDFDLIFPSSVPDACLQQECIMGIDEAGRGPVLGPMVYGGCVVVKDYEAKLKAAGHADSKGLTEETRDKLFERLNTEDNANTAYIAHIISPNVICNNMLDRAKTNLNTISHDSAIGLIQRALDAGMRVTEVVLDTVGPPDKYQAKVAAIFPQLKVTVESKADANYPVVSAASVVAKVTRDAVLRRWRYLEHLEGPDGNGPREFGSGYPSDPTTKHFLVTVSDPVFGFPQFVRTSWSTAGALMDSRCHRVRWEDFEEEEAARQAASGRGKKRSLAAQESGGATPSVLNFFTTGAPSVKRRRRHRFFRDRRLERVVGGPA